MWAAGLNNFWYDLAKIQMREWKSEEQKPRQPNTRVQDTLKQTNCARQYVHYLNIMDKITISFNLLQRMHRMYYMWHKQNKHSTVKGCNTIPDHHGSFFVSLGRQPWAPAHIKRTTEAGLAKWLKMLCIIWSIGEHLNISILKNKDIP